MRRSKIIYDPKLSVAENAERNGVSIAGIRYYIQVNHIDRQSDAKFNIINALKQYLKKHPNATRDEAAIGTGLSINTVRKYWTIAKSGQDYPSQIDRKEKAHSYQVNKKNVIKSIKI